MRTRAWRRAQRRRIINHRRAILNQVRLYTPIWPGNDRLGRLAKYNLSCGCLMCRGEDASTTRARKASRPPTDWLSVTGW